MFSDDGNAGGQLFLGPWSLASAPVETSISAFTISEFGLSPSGTDGIAVDGDSSLYFFTGANTGTLNTNYPKLQLAMPPNSENSVVLLNNGDTAITALNNNQNAMLEVAGIVNFFKKGTPVSTTSIPTVEDIFAMALSKQGDVLLARGSNIHAFSISGTPPYKLTNTGVLSYQNGNVPENDHNVPDAANHYGRGGLAISPANSDVGAVVGLDPNQTTPTPAIVALKGLRSTAAAAGSILDLTGVTHCYAVAISQDGTTAYVGTDAGIVVVTGISTGTLTQGPTVLPFAGTATTTTTIPEITTLATTTDGTALLLMGTTMPQAGKLGGPASPNNYIESLPLTLNVPSSTPTAAQNNVPFPGNDQMIAH